MFTFAEIPARDLRPWPTPAHTDIGGSVEVRMPACVEELIRAGLERQAAAGAEQPKIMAGTFDGESQAVMVLVLETEACGRLTHRAGIWPPGSAGYETVLTLPSVGRVIADLEAGGDGITRCL